MSYKPVSLESINSGAVTELFDEEFKRLLANIADENTEPNASRSITIKVVVKPQKNRESANTKISVTSALAPIKPNEGLIMFSSDGSKIQAFESDLRQPELADSTGESPFKKKDVANG